MESDSRSLGRSGEIPSAKKPCLGNRPSDVERSDRMQGTHEFPVRELEEFYKDCPAYRLPVELGSFSLDSRGKYVNDRSQLKTYSPPTKLNLDLSVGWNEFVPKKCSVPTSKLNPILRWIDHNGHQFLPKANPKSPTVLNDKTGDPQHVVTNPLSDDTRGEAGRPDNLLTNFVTWRGMLTKLMCSPYDKSEPWKFAATLFNGTVYLSEIETEESKIKNASQTPREEKMAYWGLKFEDYMTRKDSSDTRAPVEKTGTVNPQEAFCTVIRTRMREHSVVMAAEVDCCDNGAKEKAPQCYLELKTSRCIYTDRNKHSLRRFKLMKWWAQSYLVGIPRIICGFRDDDGVVKNLQTFKTVEIPKETQNDLSLWQPSVCLNFLDALLTWIREVVVVNDPTVVYIVEWKAPFDKITAIQLPPKSEHTFLPDWYILKLPPSDS